MKDIHLIENIFSQEERKRILEDSQSLFIDGKEYSLYITANENPNYGIGYQEGFAWSKITHSTLMFHPKFEWAHKIILSKIKEKIGKDYVCVRSSMNITDGNNKILQYHNHQAELSCVYYVKMFPFFSNGTLFKDYGLIKAKENSLLCFPSYLQHTTPSSPLRFKRQSWVLDYENSIKGLSILKNHYGVASKYP